MSHTTPDLDRLNNLLGQELGRRPDGHPIFAWKNSDDLFWPAFKTGRFKTETRPVELPIIGGRTEIAHMQIQVPEYARDRQLRARNTWVVTKWLSPEDLIYGTDRPHGERRGDFDAIDARPRPSHATLLEIWSERYPGADFPAHGWRVPTDATLPGREGGPREPNEIDTKWFIACVKEQTRLGFQERLQQQLDGEDAANAAKNSTIEVEIRDSFPAFLNPVPGKRSNFVSFPWTRKDRL
jgi:hypothetical protein